MSFERYTKLYTNIRFFHFVLTKQQLEQLCPHLPATGLGGGLRALETLRLGFLCEDRELRACPGMTWPSIHSAGDVGPVGEPGLRTHPEVSEAGGGV